MKTETVKELEDLNNGLKMLINELTSAATRSTRITFAIKDLLDKEKCDSPKTNIDKIARERAEKIFRDINSPDASPKKSSDDIDSWLKDFGLTVQEITKRFIDEAFADKSVKDPTPLKNQKEDEDACDCPRCTLERMIEEGIKGGKYVRRGRAVVLNGPENIDELFEKLFESLGAAKEKAGK